MSDFAIVHDDSDLITISRSKYQELVEFKTKYYTLFLELRKIRESLEFKEDMEKLEKELD
jgi:hypothetical protein